MKPEFVELPVLDPIRTAAQIAQIVGRNGESSPGFRFDEVVEVGNSGARVVRVNNPFGEHVLGMVRVEDCDGEWVVGSVIYRSGLVRIVSGKPGSEKAYFYLDIVNGALFRLGAVVPEGGKLRVIEVDPASSWVWDKDGWIDFEMGGEMVWPDVGGWKVEMAWEMPGEGSDEWGLNLTYNGLLFEEWIFNSEGLLGNGRALLSGDLDQVVSSVILLNEEFLGTLFSLRLAEILD